MENSRRLSSAELVVSKETIGDPKSLEAELRHLQQQLEKTWTLTEKAKATLYRTYSGTNPQESESTSQHLNTNNDGDGTNIAAGSSKGRKFDVSHWKYSTLRDTINASCDMDLIKTCCEEIYRRREHYDSFRSKQDKSPSKIVPKILASEIKTPGRKLFEKQDQIQREEKQKFIGELLVGRQNEIAKMERRISIDQEKSERVQRQLQKLNLKLKEQIELERRARHELASKLTDAPDTTVNNVPDVPPKPNLSTWKFLELREMIQASDVTDVDLLEACREELCKRLKVYHSWKAKNKIGSDEFQGNIRVPVSLFEETASSCTQKGDSKKEQRFFRIPFEVPEGKKMTYPGGVSQGPQKGWWYAHYDGHWIGRQMELHPDREPILLVSGKDDTRMCELHLEETRLTRKRGAEIIDTEFEELWSKHGGQSYGPRGN
ncbi:hypothetical protein TCAL_03163 [Tigriopus californicus]|uniref:Myosin VI cargo binding domain-containing protein n=1 Tax=Tigriopus californicus TaxID=6832 RepID=A0A553P3E0_TIGCA|nr:hypothetical protein TCAL_03163 [Tigriopus californicus]|eukprot:TCALIF_03163-PA protein Name:"Similar to Myo6 Unconventional myosin-VI (Mus musculus)" AED:0.35 eAED:0.35 QI:0/-1/0/1/-1/1/1/0/432